MVYLSNVTLLYLLGVILSDFQQSITPARLVKCKLNN